MPKLPKISKKNIKKTSLTEIIDRSAIKKYFIQGKMYTTHLVWNSFLKILKENEISVPKFPIWTDWWDSDGLNTSVTKPDKKLSKKRMKYLLKRDKKPFTKSTKIG